MFFDLICVASTLGGLLFMNFFPFHFYFQFDVGILLSLPMLTLLMIVTTVIISDLFIV